MQYHDIVLVFIAVGSLNLGSSASGGTGNVGTGLGGLSSMSQPSLSSLGGVGGMAANPLTMAGAAGSSQPFTLQRPPLGKRRNG